MKYIQSVPTCLPTGRDEISWNFACKVDKKTTFHTAWRFACIWSRRRRFRWGRSL